MNVSIICNTCNRGNHLRRLLIALSKQSYEKFEVIVVNGPSTDNTVEIATKYSAAIKYVECPVMRLGVSRNIGIENAAGDILVFIDDDAIPGDTNWLRKLLACYDNPQVGGVGGPVYSLQGGKQFENGYVDVWGVPHVISDNAQNFNDPRGRFFNYAMGCNCSFRRQAIEEVQGFDEYYDYFLDESDLALRIIKAGYKIIHSTDAFVFHEMATGHIRRDRYHLDWYTIVRSQAYFAIKNAADYTPDINSRIAKMKKVISSRLDDFQNYYERGYITEDELIEHRKMWEAGIKDGLAAALHQPRLLLQLKNERTPFKKFEKKCFADILNIIMLCEKFNIEEPMDGVCAYTVRLAKDLVTLGHSVHVVTNGGKNQFSLTGGVNVHVVKIKKQTIYPLYGHKTLQQVVSQSYAFMQKILQLSTVFAIDIIESPLWNSLGYAYSALSVSPPLCVRLETPLKMVVKTHQWNESAELVALEGLEKFAMRHADGIIYISDSIKNTIETLYQWDFSNSYIEKNYLGIESIDHELAVDRSSRKILRVFFIGRLERRKGVHTLLTAIPQILVKHPDTEFHIAGDDSIVDKEYGESFKAHFLREVNETVAAKVKFLGKITGEDKEKELQTCDVFVSPSLYESFGIIFLEAMRYGKPVIGCKAGGMKEIIEDGITGLLSEPDNAEDLARCINLLLDNPSLRQELGDAAYKRIGEKFNNLTQARETAKIYRHIIRQSRRASDINMETPEQIMREIFLEAIEQKTFAAIKSNICFDDRNNSAQYPFPWKSIKAGSDVVIYGGGGVGKAYLSQLDAIPYCNVTAICDKHPQQVGAVNVPVISPNELATLKKGTYDTILIAVSRKEMADEIKKELYAMEVPTAKIVWDNYEEAKRRIR